MNEQCSAVTSIYPYQTQQVRDLAWACFAPPLMLVEQLPRASGISDCAPQLTARRRMWLEQLDRDASALLAHLQQRPTHRLGLYFEQLWHFFLEQDPDTQLVAHNLPIHEGGRTLGEFDCIYFCRVRQRHVHLELAVKYFLGARDTTRANNTSAWREWLGPDGHDRLDLKLEHLLNRQIRLGEQPQAREHLQQLGIGELQREIAFRGYLFHPFTDSLEMPTGFNPRHGRYPWIPRASLPTARYPKNAQRFLILPKLRWLSPARWQPGEGSMREEAMLHETRRLLDEQASPVLVCGLNEYGGECLRFFVTPDDWPSGAGRQEVQR